MTTNLYRVRARLVGKRYALQAALERMQALHAANMRAFGPANGAEDKEEVARERAEQEEEVVLIAQQQEILNEVEQALQRLDAGLYGWCSDCGQPIPEKRLEAIPWATRDIACEARRELVLA